MTAAADYNRKYRNTHNSVDVTVVVRVNVACHPEDAEQLAERAVLAALDDGNGTSAAKVVGSALVDTEVTP